MSNAAENTSGVANNDVTHALAYKKPVQEQELRADLEEVWQDESPSTALHTNIADEVDGRLGTRHRTQP